MAKNQDIVFVSITRLRVRSWRFIPAFFLRAIGSAGQAEAPPGNLGVTVLREDRKVFWTRTLWGSEASMKSYIAAGVHRKAMRNLLDWCDEAAVAHWTQESPQAPSWQEAHGQLLRTAVKGESSIRGTTPVSNPRATSCRK